MSRKLPKKRGPGRPRKTDTRAPSGKSFKKALAIAQRAARKVAKIVKHAVAKSPAKIPFHPYSMLLPMMNASEREALKADIAANGLRDPIIMLDGQILDGRNRYEICLELGIEPQFVEFKTSWGDPLAFVYSRALHRNLKDGQKACAAVYFDEQFSEQARARALANLKQNTDKAQIWPVGVEMVSSKGEHFKVDAYDENGIDVRVIAIGGKHDGETIRIPNYRLAQFEAKPVEPGRSRDRAAALFGVSGRYVQTAKALLNHDKKLFEEVFNGAQTLSRAARAIHRDKKKKSLAAIPVAEVNLDNCTVDVADNLELLPNFPRRVAKLIIADPQYNIGFDYGKGAKADRLSDEDYLDRAEEWIAQCADILTPDGSIWIVINHEYAASYEMLLREQDLHPRAWITWYETFGNNCQENFNRTSRRLLYFTRHQSNFTFNRDPFLRPSARQIIYNDKRQDHDGKLQDDVWIIPRLVDNAKERIPEVPTQLPLALIRPIVEGCSDPGDLVVDPFNGSGTTGEACLLTGRIFRGIDISKKFAELARARWARCAANLQKLNKAELELAAGKKQEAA